MSMMDSFFAGKGFKAAKCKTLLKLTIPRIKLLRNRKEIQIKQMRREIAKLLETGQEATARIRVEHIIREEKMMAAQEILELYSELIVVRLPIIEVQRECPLDLKEAISSVCFAAPRCADLPELLQVQMLFAAKYGKEFIAAASELRPECGVSRQLIELLSVRAPAPEVKLKLLKEIAEEHQLDWNSAASETELLKPHEDLLNGSSQFVSGPNLPLPVEKLDESFRSSAEQGLKEDSDSDEYFESLDFAQVPKATLRPGFGVVPGPEMLPFPDSAISGLDDYESETPPAAKDNPSHIGVEKILQEKSGTKEPELSKDEEKQFLPFLSPPSLSSPSFPMKQKSQLPSSTRNKTEYDIDLQDVLAAAQAAVESAECAAAAARSAANLAQVRISQLVKKKNPEASNGGNENPFSGLNIQESQLRTSLYDVLEAAQAAAESGESAAASARLAASLVQVRISKFAEKKNKNEEEASNVSGDSDVPSKQDLSLLNDYGDTLNSPTQEALNISSYDVSKVEFESSPSGTDVFGADVSHSFYDDSKGEFESSPSDNNVFGTGISYPFHDDSKGESKPSSPSDDIFRVEIGRHHQPQRLPSLDDETYNSYPNLFTSSHSSYDISRSSSFADTSRTTTGGH